MALVELSVVEQRYQTVLQAIQEGVAVAEVARRFGVSRQTVHRWLRRYGQRGLGGLADGEPRPASCPHQIPKHVEAAIVAHRIENPHDGPRTILFHLARQGIEPLPSRSSVYRALVRQQLISPTPGRRKRSDYKRFERPRPMDLWQMDIVGGLRLADGSRLPIVSGIDHSRFVISAKVVVRATAGRVCEALTDALSRYGCRSRSSPTTGGCSPTASGRARAR